MKNFLFNYYFYRLLGNTSFEQKSNGSQNEQTGGKSRYL